MIVRIVPQRVRECGRSHVVRSRGCDVHVPYIHHAGANHDQPRLQICHAAHATKNHSLTSCMLQSQRPAGPPACIITTTFIEGQREWSYHHHTELIFPPTTHAACTPAHTVRDKSPESHSGCKTHRSLWASAAGEHGAGVGSDEKPDIFALVLRFGQKQYRESL